MKQTAVQKRMAKIRAGRRGQKKLTQTQLLQRFSDELKKHYPNYFAALDKLDIPENQQEATFNSFEFQEVFKRVKKRMDLRVEEGNYKKAMEGEIQSINSHMRMVERREKFEDTVPAIEEDLQSIITKSLNPDQQQRHAHASDGAVKELEDSLIIPTDNVVFDPTKK